jgi:HPt (histidine-containing phosphotransfer) domain-containing protein
MKQLDRNFLINYYQDMVDDLYEIFDLFLLETPVDLTNITDFVNEEKYCEAADAIHKIAPSFSNVGIPNLSLRLIDVENEIRNCNIQTAASCLNSFKAEFNDYMPAIVEEYQRLKLINNN